MVLITTSKWAATSCNKTKHRFSNLIKVRKSICLLKGRKPWILHDSTRGETKGIGVSQEVSRDRGAAFFLGEGPLCSQAFPAGPTGPRVSLQRDTGKESWSLFAGTCDRHGCHSSWSQLRGEIEEIIGLFVEWQPPSPSLLTSSTFRTFLTQHSLLKTDGLTFLIVNVKE